MKNITKKSKIFAAKPFLIALPIIFSLGLAAYIYQKNNIQNTVLPVTVENQSQVLDQNNNFNPINNIGENSLQNKPIHPRIVIPNKPGNIKELITILAKKAGLNVDWKLKGYYNLSAQEISQYNNPIGLIITPITDMMTFYNKELKVKWILGNAGEPFPYPVNVMTLLCGNTLMFFELEIPSQISKLLERDDFKHCTVPNATVGSVINAADLKQFDFTQPPPFLKPYDANAPQPQAGADEKFKEVQIDSKFTNQKLTAPTLKWTIPENSQPIEFKPGQEFKK